MINFRKQIEEDIADYAEKYSSIKNSRIFLSRTR